MNVRSVVALSAICIFAVAHALTQLGGDVFRRVCKGDTGDTGPLGPRGL